MLAEAAGKGKIMQRYKLNLKGGVYTEGEVYKATPIFRQQVVPGQTVNLAFEASIKTSALTKNITTPCMMSVWFFYVPHRLVWDNWTKFISKEDPSLVFPVGTRSGVFLEHGLGTFDVSMLYRRAYKLCYNEYFGSQSVGESNLAWYDSIGTDSNTSLYRLKNPEQFASRIQLDEAVQDPEFTVTASTIPLNDFYRQLMNARSQQRSQMTGDKYVDTLARMGVDATWMIAERPEFLGTKSMLVSPQLTANTSDTNLGQESARFQAKLKCEIRSKHFAEHGYIVGIGGCRPMVMTSERGTQDAVPTGGTWIDSFYSADNLETKDTAVGDVNGITADDAWTQRFAYLKNGIWQRATGTTWAVTNNATSFAGLIYPDSADLPIGDELGTLDLAYTTSVSMTGLTPVPNRVA